MSFAKNKKEKEEGFLANIDLVQHYKKNFENELDFSALYGNLCSFT